MGGALKALPEWTYGYALLRDRIPSIPNPAEIRSVAADGHDVELLRYWPREDWVVDPEAERLMLLGRREEQAAAKLKNAGWEQSATLSLLAAQPKDIEQVVKLAETSVVFEAPMDNYDVVEVTDFDRPVARGRMHYGQNYGLLSDPELHAPAEPDAARRAVIASFAGAAFQHGLPWVLLVANEEHAQQLSQGWSKATEISIWVKN